jgi:hypothetical protein
VEELDEGDDASVEEFDEEEGAAVEEFKFCEEVDVTESSNAAEVVVFFLSGMLSSSKAFSKLCKGCGGRGASRDGRRGVVVFTNGFGDDSSLGELVADVASAVVAAASPLPSAPLPSSSLLCIFLMVLIE